MGISRQGQKECYIMRSTIINNIKVTEGSKYRHLTTNEIYTIKINKAGVFKFDNDIIAVTVTPERLLKVEEV
jgi:hypothetical protein